MKVIEAKDYEHLSDFAADFLISKVRTNPRVTLGLATGGTPEGTYKRMIKDHIENKTSYQRVTTFNLDEYVGLSEHHPNSYYQFMVDHLFKDIDLPKGQYHLPNGTASDISRECKNYERLIQRAGGIDVQLLGLGSNGHIGFNEPGTSFYSRTHVVELTESTRKANARFFEKREEVPREAITMGISTIMESREIVLLVSGASKREALHQLVEGQVSEGFPASALRNHANVTIIADQKALSKVM